MIPQACFILTVTAPGNNGAVSCAFGHCPTAEEAIDGLCAWHPYMDSAPGRSRLKAIFATFDKQPWLKALDRHQRDSDGCPSADMIGGLGAEITITRGPLS